LSGALGAALTSMVCSLTIGKEKYSKVEDELKKILNKSELIRKELTSLIDKDTKAFNDVMLAFKMPKETEDQIKTRSKSIQDGYKVASGVPLETAETCEEILDLAKVVADKGNQNSITDAAISAIMAKAGVDAGVLNVRINLKSIKDERFVKRINKKLNELQKNTDDKTTEILKIVCNKI